MIVHVVTAGETINTIANRYGVSAERIILENELPNPENLVIGQSIGIRIPGVVYTVVAGDTIESVAEKNNVEPYQILQRNPQLAVTRTLIPGQTVVISYAQEEKIDTVVFNGYAYPFINQDILKKTLPFMTYLSLFTYGFNAEGDLIPIDDSELIALAKDFGVAPVMVLAPMDAQGNFDSASAHNMFTNPEVQAKVIENVANTLQEKGYQAVDIDFEFIMPEDKEAFLNFISRMNNRLNTIGLLTFVALAPKTSGEMTGVLYEAHDYPNIGGVADKVLLMTYEWGYTYSPPMPTAPINNMRNVLRYGVRTIDPNKIWMGIANYAYDWPLPFEQGKTAAESIGNQEAIIRAAKYGVNIQFDEESQSPFFNYTNEQGVDHVVWFDDVRSMNQKLRLIPEFGLNGGGVWQLMRYFPGLWMTADSLFTITKV